MRRHRRSGWGDIRVDSASYMNGVLYSKRKTGNVHAPKTKKALGNAFSRLKAVFRLLLLPLGLLGQLIQGLINSKAAHKKTPSRVRLATKELKKPTRLRQAEHITVQMDLGRPATVRAVAAIAGERPRRRGVLFGAACFVLCVLSAAVAPALAAPPEGSTIFTFCDNGRVINAVSSAGTVQDFLKENGVELSVGDEMNVKKDAPLQEGMVVSIDRAIPVTVVSGGRRLAAGIRSGTVADALKSAGVRPDENDRVSPSLDTKVRAGMTINHTVVEVAYISRTELVPYKTVYKRTSSLSKGKEKIEKYGVNGKVSHKIRINYEDGKEVSRYEIDSSVVRNPSDEVVLIGTKVASVATSGGSGSSGSSGSTGSSSSSGSSGSSSSGSSGSGAVSGVLSPSKIRTTKRMSATAYTFTGHRTATGTYPRRGTVAVNPSVIPYGTRLYIEGYGYGVAEDTGSFIYSHSNRIDLFMESLGQCYSWGCRTVNVYILK